MEIFVNVIFSGYMQEPYQPVKSYECFLGHFFCKTLYWIADNWRKNKFNCFLQILLVEKPLHFRCWRRACLWHFETISITEELTILHKIMLRFEPSLDFMTFGSLFYSLAVAFFFHIGKRNIESLEKYYIEKYAFRTSMRLWIFNMLKNSKLKIIHFDYKASSSFAEIGVENTVSFALWSISC